MTSPRNTEQFVADLRAEQDAAAAFIVLLKAEQQALRDGVAAEVERLAPEKGRMADTLARYSARRREFLTALGYPGDARGMQEWIEAHPDNMPGVAAWQRLQEHAAQAWALNEANGRLIDLRLCHCRQALAALEQACGVTTLYGPQGHTVPLSAPRSLSAA